MTNGDVMQAILKNNRLTDTEKLRQIFGISKDSLRSHNIYLYYAILAVLDEAKIPDATNYFNT